MAQHHHDQDKPEWGVIYLGLAGTLLAVGAVIVLAHLLAIVLH